jgi:hypothetical protein
MLAKTRLPFMFARPSFVKFIWSNRGTFLLNIKTPFGQITASKYFEEVTVAPCTKLSGYTNINVKGTSTSLSCMHTKYVKNAADCFGSKSNYSVNSKWCTGTLSKKWY